MKEVMNRHERRRLRTRARLEESAVEMILEKGYDSVSIMDITDRADLGRGTFYIHFKDKEDLVWSVIRTGLDSADRAARQMLEGKPLQGIEYFGYLNIFQHAAQNRDLYRIMLSSKGSSTLTGRVQDYLADDLAKDMDEGAAYRDLDQPSMISAQIVIGAIVRLVTWWLEAPNAYTPQQMAAFLYETLHRKPAPQAEA
jgi:AcrR family transcriptional regulator